MHGSRNLCQRGREGEARLPKNNRNNIIFNPQLILQFYRGGGGGGGGGGQAFLGVQLFSGGGGGGGGVQMLISIKTHITCDFPEGSGPPVPPLDLRMF